MVLSLKCSQVMALLSFYVRDKLDLNLRQIIKEHLDKCPVCYDKYLVLKSMLKKTDNNSKINNLNNTTNEAKEQLPDENLIATVSAYFDNELTDGENLRVKKYAISNSAIRKSLENFYAIKKMLFETFEKDRQEFRYDFSKNTLNLLNIGEEIRKIDPVLNAVSLLTIILTVVIIFAAVVFWV